MGGGLIQLIAVGIQDIYLIGNPQITYFKTVYKKHTNFAIESIYQSIDGRTDFGQTIEITIARKGDLIKDIIFEIIKAFGFFKLEKLLLINKLFN